MLKNLLGCDELPDNYYAVYKNITKYSIWEMESLLELNSLPKNDKGIKKLNEQTKVLSTEYFNILKKEKNKYIIPNKNNYGIPQGSAISTILSSIYMLEFDKKFNEYIYSKDGLYMRYSDDFIAIIPGDNEESFKKLYADISNLIKSIPKLSLQPDETQIFKFERDKIISCNELVLEDVKNGNNILNYLGFSFDGKKVSIRDKTLSKYHYRMYRKLKTIVKCNGVKKYGNKVSCRELYNKYSIKGAFMGKGNFITYIIRCEKIFGKNEAIRRGTGNHMQKIRKKLRYINLK